MPPLFSVSYALRLRRGKFGDILHIRRQMLLGPGTGIITIEAQREFLEPLCHGLNVAGCIFGGDSILYYCVAISEEVVAPVTVFLSCAGDGSGVRHCEDEIRG